MLVIDDERNIRSTLSLCLEAAGCKPTAVSNGAQALEALRREPFDLAFLDLQLGNERGQDLLPRLLGASPGLHIAVITAFATVDSAVELMRQGASDYLPKPFSPPQIRHLVERAAQQLGLLTRLHDLEARLSQVAPEALLSSASPTMEKVFIAARRSAPFDVPMLLLGESGTGKGVLAQAIHALSARRDGPFVVVNCPTLSEELLGSELFGHVEGAFTGAVRDQPGRVETADGGTLFLDEIAEIPPSLQAKLLRFLQEKRFERLGESRTRTANVRILAATNKNIATEIAAGRFREDLYYRLNAVELSLPALRERPEDILPLAQRFTGFFAKNMQRPPPALDGEVRQRLQAYSWPGNVRELRNTIERALIFSSGQQITSASLPERLLRQEGVGVFLGGNFTLEQVKQEHIQQVMDQVESLGEASRTLGIDASTLWRFRKRVGEGK